MADPASPRLREMLARERLARGACSVERVGLGTVASRRPRRTIDLHHPLALLEQEAGETGAEAARAFDRPDAPAGRLLAREAEQSLVAERVRGERHFRGDGTARVADCGRVRVAMRVHADHVVDPLCEHSHRDLLAEVDRVGAGLGMQTARQDCDESRPLGRTGF